MDGVLIHTMPLHATAWLKAVRRRRVSVSEQEIYQWEGEPGTTTAKRLLKRHGKSFSKRSLLHLLKDKERLFSRHAKAKRVRIQPGWLKLIGRLRSRRIKLALVTGTSARELHRMLSNRFLENFQTVIPGDLVSRGKPNPEPYRMAIHAMRVPNSQAAVIENAPYGIRSAKLAQCGLVIALASSLPVEYLYQADLTFKSSSQLQSWLLQYLGQIDKSFSTRIQ